MIVIKVYYLDIKKYNIDKKQGSALLKKQVLKERGIFFTDNGKPYCSDMFFNISHSGDLVVLCTASSEIGVDIEKIRGRNMKAAKKCFNENEKVSTTEEFFDMWTKKESIIKYLGKTVGDMKSINSADFKELLKPSDFFKGYAFCICSEDNSETEYIKIQPSE